MPARAHIAAPSITISYRDSEFKRRFRRHLNRHHDLRRRIIILAKSGDFISYIISAAHNAVHIKEPDRLQAGVSHEMPGILSSGFIGARSGFEISMSPLPIAGAYEDDGMVPHVEYSPDYASQRHHLFTGLNATFVGLHIEIQAFNHRARQPQHPPNDMRRREPSNLRPPNSAPSRYVGHSISPTMR